MQLTQAILHLTPFALDADRGADGLIVLSPAHGGIAYARQRGATLIVRIDAPSSVVLLDAESVRKAAGTIKAMDKHPAMLREGDKLVLEQLAPEDEADDDGNRPVAYRAVIQTVDLGRLPPALQQAVGAGIPFPRPEPFVEVDRSTWRAVQRVATCAATPKDDRAGLEVISMGPQWAETTNEVLVARAPMILPGTLRVPAALLEYVPAYDLAVGVGDSRGGIVIASSAKLDEADVVLLVDDPRCRAGFFPALDRTWELFAWGRRGVKVKKAELRAAVAAAKLAASKGPLGLVVRLDVTDRMIQAIGAENATACSVIPPPERAKDAPPPTPVSLGAGLFASAPLLTAIASMDGTVEVIVHPGAPPVLELRSVDQRVLISGMAELAQPFAAGAPPAHR
jgi:hypothetical protein